MKIENNILIAECTSYDFKEMLEMHKVKSWLKSISAFANGIGGSLFYGVKDSGEIVGIEDVQSCSEFISERIKAQIDPIPTFELIPFMYEDKNLLEVRVYAGNLTPYCYYQDGARTAFVRVGSESVAANSQQLQSLVLKGTNKTWDSLVSTTDENLKVSFSRLANTFYERTHQQWDNKYLKSFGLEQNDGILTNAGLMFMDSCPVYQSQLYCTRWTGLYKDNAVHSVEYKGNILHLLHMGTEFVKTFTMKGWVKMSNHRLNVPDYADRAVLEAIVNHLIHRDYTYIGAEVHIDIYDDRIEFVSPGGMVDGTLIQNRDIRLISSQRRNPIIAEVFHQLDFMEKRGSGLRKILELTASLPNYDESHCPKFISEGSQFVTILYNVNWKDGKRIEICSSKSSVTEEKGSVTEEKGSVTEAESSVRGSVRKIGRTTQRILDMVVADASVTQEKMAEELGITKRSVEKQVAKLKDLGLLSRSGGRYGGFWKVNI